MHFKPRNIYEVCVQAQYLENVDKKKVKPRGSKHKENTYTSKEERKGQEDYINYTLL